MLYQWLALGKTAAAPYLCIRKTSYTKTTESKQPIFKKQTN